MRRALIVLLILSPLLALYAQSPSPAAQGDALNDKGQYLDARKIELDAAAAASPAEKAELYWRAARETMELGDLSDKARKPQADTLAIFSEGEGYADKA
ncbi:MAG TPA: hypothetical protein VFH83_10700, partial [Spirochaetia bacterium]|nr:hypothetical protein [Spirochaetia bacterium]